MPSQKAGGQGWGRDPETKAGLRVVVAITCRLSPPPPTVALAQTSCVSYQANRTLSCFSWPSLHWARLCGMGRDVGLRGHLFSGP